jgi:hypothetical protein
MNEDIQLVLELHKELSKRYDSLKVIPDVFQLVHILYEDFMKSFHTQASLGKVSQEAIDDALDYLSSIERDISSLETNPTRNPPHLGRLEAF